MNRFAQFTVTILALLGAFSMPLVSPVLAQANGEHRENGFDLMVGDDAPKLAISHWIKGAPVEEFEKGKVYIVEFWATWCFPCVQRIPDLNEIQKDYKEKGLTVVSVTSPDPRNTLEQVKGFVEERGDGMDYVIAFDDTTRTTDKTWMVAAGKMVIPTAFIVDQKGKIAWIGHTDHMNEPVAQIVAGTYDLAQEAKAYAKNVEGEARAIKQAQRLSSAMQKVGQLAMKLAERKYDEASVLGRTLVEGEAKDLPRALSAIAWVIVDPQQPHETRDLDLALAAAQRAVELNGWKDADSVDTLAWCYYHRKDFAKAVEIEAKAIEVATEQIRPFVEASMKTFKAAQTSAE